MPRAQLGDEGVPIGRDALHESEFECYMREPFGRTLRPIILKELPDKTAEVKAGAEEFGGELGRLEKSMDASGWLAGREVSAADVAVYPFIKLAARISGNEQFRPLFAFAPIEKNFPKLGAWIRRVEALPGYEKTYPPHWKEADAKKAA